MTSLHARAAAILAGDLRPDVRGVIEELVETLADVEYRNDKQATELRIAWRAMDNMRLAAVPASPSTDSEAGQ